ncbi:2-C-methyl-D-erythritol 4-phosphate cytidylyltransferase [Sedimentisphaera cyanobacteriorum]|uniref:2-C-methyl-D-erythritol 4-phosphate cytidylyltransferase n=1 Tax=Sedimentisphaera cyanobacteriorum TaxID=1940790 RepID=A0A1Q2HQJ6_9BACT|nr:2-C-methyl-D-erythritol 4-phosphate cytidylyltransferase [Sedimentisphaera cyanobacteriorum]AQQ09621.1 2-C-methyl-D-erythritol 4-phosphate cytidylyltransferase [Sedimentisphaera cyanobacteriorum]
MKAAVIICAAGGSTRFEGKTKKVFEKAAGKPLFLHSVNLFSEMDEVVQIILAAAEEDHEKIKLNWEANLAFAGVQLSAGGQTRGETVAKAFEMVSEAADIVAVHDAARCCLTEQWARKVLQKAYQTGAAIPASPVTATLKRVSEEGVISETVNRNSLYSAQTPQAFSRELFAKALAKCENLAEFSDDSMMAENIGAEVHIVETDDTNIKVTKKADIAVANAVISSREKKTPKTIHPFREDQMW